jgi:lipopolysaccharide/colanic/teichoic acid biosynthesis glycosyltransferase
MPQKPDNANGSASPIPYPGVARPEVNGAGGAGCDAAHTGGGPSGSNGRAAGPLTRGDGPHSSPMPREPELCCGAAKQLLDVLLSLGLLVVAVPVGALFGLLMRLTSKGPALYWQTRVGRGGRPFRMVKLRSMRHDCELESGAVWSQPGDPRVTRLGRFLRWSHVDELPQLWNVLRGEMSLVGPRPERPEFVPKLAEAIPEYSGRLAVRPGITGLAQIYLPPDSTMGSVRRKLTYDLYYIRHRNLWLDVRLILCTALRAVKVPHSLLRALLSLPGPAEIEGHRSGSLTPSANGQECPAAGSHEETAAERNGTVSHPAGSSNGTHAAESFRERKVAEGSGPALPAAEVANGRETAKGGQKAEEKPRKEVVH